MKGIRERLPSPAMIVALVALVAATSGTAVALQGKNSVKSNDIAPGAVKARDLARNAVKPPKLDLVSVDGETGPFATASKPAVPLGGPSVRVRVPRTGLIAVYARGTGQIVGGGQNARAQIHLHEPRLLSGSPRILEFSSSDPQLRVTTPGTGDVDGASSLARGGWLVFPASPGRYEFELRYSVAGSGQAIFSNTGLWVGVIG